MHQTDIGLVYSKYAAGTMRVVPPKYSKHDKRNNSD